MRPGLVYLDNAATSYPKPPAVAAAMLAYMSGVGVSPGRGDYAESRAGAEIIRRCRARAGELVGAEQVGSGGQVVFTLNATDALNLAIHGVVRAWRRGAGVACCSGEIPARGKTGAHRRDACATGSGGSEAHGRGAGPWPHVVTTAMDHNSVLRPLNSLAAEGLAWTCVPADPVTGRVDPADIRRAIRPDTALVVVNHASNVTGTIQPVAEIGEICSAAGVLYLVDLAQSAGHVPVSVGEIGCDLAAMPGHKGLLGPLGTGVLWIRAGVEARVDPARQGGTGTVSELDEQPTTLPEKYEPGSHNAVGIAGLEAGLAWIQDRGVGSLRRHEVERVGRLLDGLRGVAGLRVVGPAGVEGRVGVASVVHESLAPAEMARRLDEEHGVIARAGLHCAPRAHRAVGTFDAGGAPGRRGAVRMSVGPFTTADDIDRAVDGLRRVCAEPGVTVAVRPAGAMIVP